MQNGVPEIATDAEILFWTNMGAVLAPDGSAEIIQ
jgi:hypothetical protein